MSEPFKVGQVYGRCIESDESVPVRLRGVEMKMKIERDKGSRNGSVRFGVPEELAPFTDEEKEFLLQWVDDAAEEVAAKMGVKVRDMKADWNVRAEYVPDASPIPKGDGPIVAKRISEMADDELRDYMKAIALGVEDCMPPGPSKAGKALFFLLITDESGIAQYVGNIEREDTIKVLREAADRIEGRKDNPDYQHSNMNG